jgi:uncharacterized protein (TIGR02145 family)
MKKLTNLFILMILGSSMLFAQDNINEQIENKDRITYTDVDPNVKLNPHATSFTDDLFGELFQFPCGDCNGEAGIETNGDYIYTSKWNGEGFFCYLMDGTYLGWFDVPGTAGIRDMAYDGSYFYGAAANTTLFEMKFDGLSGTLISTLNAAVATRAIAYNPNYDAFYGNNWSDPITLYDRSGNILNQFNCGDYSSYYGFAWLDCGGSPCLYGFAQSGGASQSVIVQIDPETGEETGVTFDAIEFSSTGTGIAGGLAAIDLFVPGYWTILGIIQNETIFCIEGCVGLPTILDLELRNIYKPNSGFELGIENIIIWVKNNGYLTQSNFDVRYRVNECDWITETMPGPLAMGETWGYSFYQAYDFTEFGIYDIEAEVLLPIDNNPENNTYNKTIENYDPSEWCYYSIILWDDYGNGWGSGLVQIFGDSIELINATLITGTGSEIFEFQVRNNMFLQAVYTAGNFPNDNSYAVYDVHNNLIFEDGMNGTIPTGGDIGYASCEPLSIDAGVSYIVSPHYWEYPGIEYVVIKIKNFGTEELLDIPVGFNLNSTGWINEVFAGPISPNEEAEYAFTATADLTEPGTYFIEACTFVPDDEAISNDCLTKEIDCHECEYMPGTTAVQREYIANVSMGMIDHSSGWQGWTADYTDLFTNINIGLPQEIVVTIGNVWPNDDVFVWVDWNDDCMFETGYNNNEEYQLNGTGAIFTGDIIAPLDVILGPHQMRVRLVYDNNYPCPTCDYTYGEVEDYTLVVYDTVAQIIKWDPHFFTQFVEYESTAQDFLTIKNIGEDTLFWNIEVVSPWLTVGPLEGMLFPLESETVTLDFNAGGLPGGTELNDDIILFNNDLVYSEIIIPVKMIVGPTIVTKTFNLEDGFQFISSNITTPDPDMMVLIEDILNDNLDFIRNSEGQTLRKIGSNWVNGIGDWIIEEGYLVKMFNEDSFTMEGVLIDPTTPIPVETGFQFVSFLPDTSIDALFAFETIIGDELDFIRNTNGQTLRKIGPNWVNGIGDCQPQEGYLVKMFSDDILIYPFFCGNPFTDFRDGQIYRTVLIGGQCWMAENLNIGEIKDAVLNQYDNGIIEKYCYDNLIDNCDEYGGYYQWNEMMQYVTDTATQGICPEGWYLPTDFDWKILEGTVDSQYPVGDTIWNHSGLRGFDAGLNLKSTNGWNFGGNGTDLYGFTGLSCGHRSSEGEIWGLGSHAYFWTSSESSTDVSWRRDLYSSWDKIQRAHSYRNRGCNVRCLKNNSYSNSSFIGKLNKDNELSNHKNSNIETIHFLFDGGNPADPVYTIYIEGFEIGNEIAAFDGETLIGATKINSYNKFENDLPVFNTLSSGQGYTSGNQIILKVWDKSENAVYILNDYTFSNPYGNAWTENVFPAKDGEYSLLHFSTTGISDESEITQTISIYPNPSEGIFNISIEGVSGKVQIKVFDVHGNDYRFFEIEGTKNMTTEQLDLKELAAGVYFINFSGKNFNQVKKIVIQ